MHIDTLAQLEALYGAPRAAAVIKVADHVTALYRPYIEASPFVALATAGPDGLDCSPRGDVPGFVRIADPKTLILPDRRGNNRCDSLRNIIADPRAALLFLVPGSDTCLRAMGRARISIDPALLAPLAMDGVLPRSAIVLHVEAVYFQCSRALMRSQLWDSTRHAPAASLPSAGSILADMSDQALGGDAYDAAWPQRARQTLW